MELMLKLNRRRLFSRELENQKGLSPIVMILIIIGVIVAVFIGVSIFMAGAGTATFNTAQIDARNNKRTQDIDAISKALEGYYGQDKPNEYPVLKPEWFTTKSVPVDVNGANYSGVPVTSVSSFRICATLEGNKPQYCVDSQHK